MNTNDLIQARLFNQGLISHQFTKPAQIVKWLGAVQSQDYHPLNEALEVLSITAVTNGVLDEVPVEDVRRFEEGFHQYVIKHHKKLIDTLNSGKKVTDEVIKEVKEAGNKFKKTFVN